MNFTTHNLVQGTPAWRQHRAKHRNSSEAAAMLGISKYCSRGELLRQAATGLQPDIDAATQRRFDDGHAYEEQARPWAEEIIGEEIYPATVSADVGGLPLSASLDGTNMAGTILWEHKTLNQGLAASLERGEIPEEYWPQMDQALGITGAVKCLFMASNGSRESMRHAWYTPDLKRFRDLLAGWRQFDEDVRAYRPDPAVPEAVGRAPAGLPALRIEVTGMVTASNLDEFKSHAIAVFRGINTNLQTDQDFADADKTVKWCGEIETKLKAAKDHALSQTQSIDTLFRAIDEIGAEARAKRLELEKLVKARKDAIRWEIVRDGKAAYDAHEAALRAECGAWTMLPQPDFGGAIKNLRTVDSVRNAVQTALAHAKIKADESARTIRAALAALDEEAKGHEILFSDRLNFINMIPEAVRLMVRDRIAKHQAAEQARAAGLAEKERERIRAEEVAKLQAPPAPDHQAEQRRREEAQRPSPPPPAAPAAPAPVQKPRMRAEGPTVEQIIEVLADHYFVSHQTVIGWLERLNLRAAA